MPKSILYISLFLLSCHSSVKYPPGGYDYPEAIADKDSTFYRLPLKNKMSRLDSFRMAYAYSFYKDFDEPNLSLHPLPTTVFRFLYSPTLSSPIFIILTEDQIITKKGQFRNFDAASSPDTSLLTPLEQLHLNVLNRYFPLDDHEFHMPKGRRISDSMGRLYPQLYSPAYYRQLLDKSDSGKRPFYTYTINRIKITPEKFRQLVQQINSSGYWRLPGVISSGEIGYDGYGFTLEANTPQKYNLVTALNGYTDSTKAYFKACQQLISEAQLDKEIELYSDRPPTTDSVHIFADTQLPEVKEEPRPRKKRR